MHFRQNKQSLNTTTTSLPPTSIEDGNSKILFRGKNTYEGLWRKQFVLFRSIALVVILVALTRNNFLLIRKFYVGTHYMVAPTASKLGFPSDLSEGAIYKHLPSNVTLPDASGGCVWDVGANNGIWNSNSFYLIHAKKYHAWLFEPDAATFLKLRNNYANHPRVKLHNFGLSSMSEIITLRLFPMGFENTIQKSKSNQADSMEFSYDIAVQNATLLCEQQRQAISNGLCDVETTTRVTGETTKRKQYTVLSIDAEGADATIFRSAHKMGCHWDLVITEGRTKEAAKLGYELVMEKAYNSIYAYRGK